MIAPTLLVLAAHAATAALAKDPRPVDPVATAAARSEQVPLNAQAYARSDEFYARRDQPGAAEAGRRFLEQELAVSPLDTGLLWRYGRARVATGDRTNGWGRNEHFVAAEQALQSALDVDPGLLDARYWLAEARLRRGRYKEALESLNAALTLAPDDARLHHLAGDIRWRAPRLEGGDRELAVQEYEKALGLSGRYLEDYLSLAEAYEALGRPGDAGTVLDRLAKAPAADAGLAGDDRRRLDRLRRRLKR